MPRPEHIVRKLDLSRRRTYPQSCRTLLADPPEHTLGQITAFCDFAGPSDESVLATCNGNHAEIVDASRSRDTMNSVGRFLNHFRRLNLNGHQIAGDEGYGRQLMDRMQEEGFYLQRINNGSAAKRRYLFQSQRRVVVDRWSTHRKPADLNSERRKAHCPTHLTPKTL